MKFASFEVPTEVGSVQRIGVVESKQIIDLTAGYEQLLHDEGEPYPQETARHYLPPEMTDMLRRGELAIDAAQQTVEYVESVSSESSYAPSGAKLQYDLDSVKLLSPVPNPNTIRDCSVYFEEHIKDARDIDDAELPEPFFEMPIHYMGNPNAIVHPGDDVTWPSYSDKLDFELEIAAVIGKEGKNIPAEQAEDYIFGYTIFNDFSARDMQRREKETGFGFPKGKDFANGFGPYLVDSDAVDITDLTMRARINDECWTDTDSSGMYHSWAEIVEHVSNEVTIYPGDIIGSGTVGGGCGLELDRWIEPGDVIELDVEDIGTLSHRVVKPDQ